MTTSHELRSESSDDNGNTARAEQFVFYKDPVFALIFLGTFTLYLISMPKTIALEDDSIFILAGYFNGISHPPGYPLYTLILNFFTKIPIGDIPARAHACSAFFAALSCCGLFIIFCLAGLDRYISALGSIMFSVTATFWSQSIITEVYSLNVLLNLCLFLFALKITLNFDQGPKEQQAAPRDFILFSITLGLALSNHWPLTILALPGYLLLIARPFFGLRHKLVVVLPAAGIVIISYLYLYFNNQSSPFINFSGKFSDIGELLDFVMRRHYASVDFEETAGWRDKWQFTRDVLLQIGRELNLLLIPAALGLYRLLKSPELRQIGLAISWVVLANSLLLVLLVNFDYSYLFSLVFQVYPIVSIAMLFVLAGFGMVGGTAFSGPKIATRHLYIILVPGLAFNVYSSLPQNYRHHYSWGEEYAQKILSEIPANATLFSDGEVELGQLSYYHFVKKHRPDIELYSSSALLLDNRLFDFRLEDKKTFIENLVAENQQRQFYVANNYYGLSTVSGTVFTHKLGKPDGKSQQSINQDDIDLILKWSSGDYAHDAWTRVAVKNLRQKAIAIITPTLKSTTDPGLKQYLSSAILELIQSEAEALEYLMSSINDESEINPQVLQTQLDAINRENLISKQDDSHYVYLIARSSQARQTAEHISNSRQQACQNWPSRKNIYCAGDTGS